MTERCHNCGAELFAGQQFCRRCGAGVRAEGGEAPTQLFPPGGAPTGPQGTSTTGLGGRGTDPVRDPRPTGYQPPLGSFQQTSPLAATPAAAAPRKGRGRGRWLVALVAVAVLSVLGTLALVFALSERRRQPPAVTVIRKGGVGVNLPQPPAPPGLPARVREAAEAAGAPLPLDESGAEVSGGQTEFVKTFELAEGGAFSLKLFSGPVTVEGWDEPHAEVRVVKRGGTPATRRAVPVMSQRDEETLTLSSPAGRGTNVTVGFEVKLPRSLRQVEVAAETSDVRLSGLGGAVVVDVKTGRLEFRDVVGVVRSQVIKGHTKVTYERADREGPQEFKSNLGDVEINFPDEFNADLKAETVDGHIEADDSLGLSVVRARVGRHVVGRLGEGREPLLVRVVNGDIKLKR